MRTLIEDMGLGDMPGVTLDDAKVLMAVRGYHEAGEEPDVANIGDALDIGEERTREALLRLRSYGRLPGQTERYD
jgi:hypothetical protein